MKTDPLKSFRPKKSFGQNFLINTNVQRRIVDSCQLNKNDTAVEIGPGKGAITKFLLDEVSNLVVIEKDKQLVSHLKRTFMNESIEIVTGDILRFDFKNLPRGAVIVGNLPYNIATAIIEKIITFNAKFNYFHYCYFMLQLEHGKRITAKPGSKDYGAFSLFVQYHSNPKILFRISNACFYPKPKVQSCFIRLEFPAEPKYQFEHEDFLFKTIRCAFSQRRKTILNTLSQICSKDILQHIFSELNLSPSLRAENLELSDFIEIAKKLERTREGEPLE